MSQVNEELIANLLLDDPETGERLAVDSMGNEGSAFVITIRNAEGDRRWKHSIVTTEV